MSENRFWFVIDKGKLEYVQDNVTNETITVTELEDLLNELHEENQQLKNDCGILVQSNQEYRKENEQLQIENKRLREKLNDCEKFRYTVFKRMEELIDKGVE